MAAKKSAQQPEQTALVLAPEFQPVIDIVLNSLESVHSKRAYEKSLTDFLNWWAGVGRPALSKAVVLRYKTEVLDTAGLSSSTVNVRLSAIRKLAAEAADNGLIERALANGIANIKGRKTEGVRVGLWLTKAQAQKLLNAPDITTPGGLRDRAILACLLGAGLRRAELAALTFEHIQQRDGRWAIVDIVGKRSKIRSVPISGWVKVSLDAWAQAAGITAGRVFVGINHYGKSINPKSAGVTSQVIYDVVQKYGLEALGEYLAPHDLRRTFAKLARKGGAELSQIQLSLGHGSVVTTQKYVGEDQNFTDAPCDRLGLALSGD